MTLPCKAAPDDWAIERSGRQYRDEEIERWIFAPAEDDITDWVIDVLDLNPRDSAARELAIEDLEAKRIKENLIARRKARDVCHLECPARLACLSLGMAEENLEHGIWGGYYSEERRAIAKAKAERDERRRLEADSQ